MCVILNNMCCFCYRHSCRYLKVLSSTGGTHCLLNNVMASRITYPMLLCRQGCIYIFLWKLWWFLLIDKSDPFLHYQQLSSNEVTFRQERLYVNKLNIILVQVCCKFSLFSSLWQFTRSSNFSEFDVPFLPTVMLCVFLCLMAHRCNRSWNMSGLPGGHRSSLILLQLQRVVKQYVKIVWLY